MKKYELLKPMPTDAIKVHIKCRSIHVNPLQIKSLLILKDFRRSYSFDQLKNSTWKRTILQFHTKSYLFSGNFITDSEKRKRSAVIPVRSDEFRYFHPVVICVHWGELVFQENYYLFF